MTYQEYLHTPRWRELRAARLAIDGYRCRACDGTQRLEVHHRRYGNPLGSETVDDLTTLCGGPCGCHSGVEKAIRARKLLPEVKVKVCQKTGRGSAELARHQFRYDPATGKLHWQNPASPRARIGSEAGSVNKMGYRVVWFSGRIELIRRIVWLIHTGSWPILDINSIDGDPLNTRIENLRELSRSSVLRLREPAHTNKTGHAGVYAVRDKWIAGINVGRRRQYLGIYPTRDAAASAYLEARKILLSGGNIDQFVGARVKSRARKAD